MSNPSYRVAVSVVFVLALGVAVLLMWEGADDPSAGDSPSRQGGETVEVETRRPQTRVRTDAFSDTGSVSLQVVNGDGEPWLGATVRAVGIAEDGSWSVEEDLPTGRGFLPAFSWAAVFVNGPKGLVSLCVFDGVQTDVVATLPSERVVEARFQRAEGAPADGVDVALVPPRRDETGHGWGSGWRIGVNQLLSATSAFDLSTQWAAIIRAHNDRDMVSLRSIRRALGAWIEDGVRLGVLSRAAGSVTRAVQASSTDQSGLARFVTGTSEVHVVSPVRRCARIEPSFATDEDFRRKRDAIHHHFSARIRSEKPTVRCLFELEELCTVRFSMPDWTGEQSHLRLAEVRSRTWAKTKSGTRVLMWNVECPIPSNLDEDTRSAEFMVSPGRKRLHITFTAPNQQGTDEWVLIDREFRIDGQSQLDLGELRPVGSPAVFTPVLGGVPPGETPFYRPPEALRLRSRLVFGPSTLHDFRRSIRMSLNVGRPTSIRGLPEGRFWFLFSREGWPQLVSGWTFEKTTLKWEFDMPGSGQFRPTIPLRKSIRRTLVLVAEAPLDKRAFGRGALVSPDGSARELVFSSRSGGDPRELRCKAELTGGRHHLLVRVSSGASGYFAEVSFDVTESGSDDAQRIDLSDASSVEVMAVDADGRAVPRAVVTLVPKDPRWRGVGEVLTFATNSAGLLRERGFKPGTTYRIQGTDVDVTAGGTRVTIVMP